MKTNNFYLKIIKLSVIILLIIILFIILKKNFYNVHEGAETIDEQKVAELDKIIQNYTDDMRKKLKNIIDKKTNEAKNFTLGLIAEYEMINKDILKQSYELNNEEKEKINSLKSKIQSRMNNYNTRFNNNIEHGVFIDLHTVDKDKIQGLISNYV